MKNTKILWFTGLSGSGKTTIAERLQEELEKDNKKIKVFDGDIVRTTLHKHLGFSPEDIKENNQLIAELCLNNLGNYDYILVPIISPFRESRDNARNILKDNFVEIYVSCPLEKCIERDVKGHYKKAFAGEIKNFIGIDKQNPYEPPISPELTVYSSKETLDKSVKKILEFLKANSF